MRGEARNRKVVVMWWDHDWGWVGWLAMTVGMAGFWILVVLLVLLIVRADRRRDAEELGPRQVLERRLARGEIDVEEYRERLAAMSQEHR
jgi:putative membrane protein